MPPSSSGPQRAGRAAPAASARPAGPAAAHPEPFVHSCPQRYTNRNNLSIDKYARSYLFFRLGAGQRRRAAQQLSERQRRPAGKGKNFVLRPTIDSAALQA